MAINLRSPYSVGVQAPIGGHVRYEIFVYTTTKPGTPTYTIRKNRFDDSIYGATLNIEISELIRDYLDVFFNGQYLDSGFALLVEIEYYVINSSGSQTDSGDYSVKVALDSYSYFENKTFDVHDKSLAQSNKVVFVPSDTSARIPISTYNSPTVTFLKNNEVVGSYSFSRSSTASNQLEYLTLDGEKNYDDYKERVLLFNSGVLEESKCLTDFFNEFEIGEADEVRISDDKDNLEVVKVKHLDECKYEPKRITFVNRFGALQDMYFFKKFVEKMNVKRETYKRNIVSGGNYSQFKHQQQQFNTNAKKSFTLSSGYVSEEYNDVFQELLLSEYVWLAVDEKYDVVPINVKTSNITYKTSLNDRLVEYTIEFDYSFDTINNIR